MSEHAKAVPQRAPAQTHTPPARILQRNGAGPEHGRTHAGTTRESARMRSFDDMPPGASDALRFPGQPLDLEARIAVVRRLGHDFGRVSLHAPTSAVSGYGDAPEREADAIAERVLQAPVTPVPALDKNDRSMPPGRGVTSHESVLAGGNRVPEAMRNRFEPHFGSDLSGVRIHTDARAATAARILNARAFATDGHIYFGAGEYQPETPAGQRLIAHELAHTLQAHAPALQRQVMGPPVATGAGADFDMFMLEFSALESAAVAEGYTQDQCLTAFRKIFYDSGPAKTYAGVTTGGGAFDILIPGAAATKLPSSWATPGLDGAVSHLKSHKVMTIGGKQVDIGHMLAGADASKHPTGVSLAGGLVKLRSNVAATTYAGDLGSVVTEYIHGSPGSFYDVAMKRSPLLDDYYDSKAKGMAPPEDMAGNADAYALTLDPAKSLTKNLVDYYAATTGGAKRRYTAFAAAIGLGTLSGGKFSGDTPAWRTALHEEVFNSALAYAAAKGWKTDVVNVMKDPGPGLITPTFWEMYWNVSEWVVDIFVSRMVGEVTRE